MQILLKTYQRRSMTPGEIIPLEVDPSDLIEDLRLKIERVEGTSPRFQSLIFAGRYLQDGKRLSDYKMNEGTTIHLWFPHRFRF